MSPLSANPFLSVIVPVRNEAENIASLIIEIRAALDGVEDYELIYVDDGSTDATLAVLKKELAKECSLLVYRHQFSCGQSAAIWTGVNNARGSIIATLDGDGQNDPADIPVLLDRLRASGKFSNTMVVGWRTARKDTRIKRLSSLFANILRKTLLKDKTPDTGCGIKVFPRQVFLAFPRFDHMHRFLPALMIRGGGDVVSVPVNHRHRIRGSSNYGILDRAWVSIWDVLGVIWLLRRCNLPVLEDIDDPEATNGDAEV